MLLQALQRKNPFQQLLLFPRFIVENTSKTTKSSYCYVYTSKKTNGFIINSICTECAVSFLKWYFPIYFFHVLYLFKCSITSVRFDNVLLCQVLHKIPQFHLISWCGNFEENHSFPKVLSDSRETIRKLYFSTPGNQLRLRYFMQ